MSMTEVGSDHTGTDDSKEQLILNEAHHLSKRDIILELERRGYKVSADTKRDLLRKQLTELVREETKSSRSARRE